MAESIFQPDYQPPQPPHPNGLRQNLPVVWWEDSTRYEEPSIVGLPSNDNSAWYYPSHEHDSDDDTGFTPARGNWGRKTAEDARWMRTGKMVAWTPNQEDREAEDRGRKRIKLLLPQRKAASASFTLPHLRSPSPPLVAPYPTPTTQHLSYTSFVMDKAVTTSFRSRLLDELEYATNGLIEGEATMRRALGRLWQVMSEDPDRVPGDNSVVPKREDEEGDDQDERERRLARAPDLTPTVHKLFISSGRIPTAYESQFVHPEMQEIQLDTLGKSLSTLRGLQDDGREYVERLEEIRDGLGGVRTQRGGVWDLVRRKAIRELQDAASSSAL